MIRRKKNDPPQESREHLVKVDQGLITVCGGKLTLFRKMAWDVLKAARPYLDLVNAQRQRRSALCPARPPRISHRSPTLSAPRHLLGRLVGRYGQNAALIAEEAARSNFEIIPGTNTLWAELPFAAANENIYIT